MIRSVLIGLFAGARALTPLAMVSDAARRGALPAGNGAPALLGHPLVVAAIAAVALGELGGDKMKTAPDRIVAPGIAARLVSGAIAGAALAPREQRVAAGLLGAAVAVGSAYVSFDLRMRALRRWGQTPSGLVEDLVTVAGSWAAVHAGRRADA